MGNAQMPVNTRRYMGGNSPIGRVALVFPICCAFFCAVAHADGECTSGYGLVDTDDINFNGIVHTIQNECQPGYEKYFGDYRLLYPVARNVVTRCPSGQRYSSGSCVSYSQAGCANGFVYDTVATTVSAFEPAVQNECVPGYVPLYNSSRTAIGYPIFSFSNKCATGYYPTSNGCVARSQSDCPSGYLSVAPDAGFARYNVNDECDTNYTDYGDTPVCAQYLGVNTADFCTPLCNYGYNHTHADTCARPCNDLHYLMTSNGIQLPLYLDKTTTRAMAFGAPNDGVCYLNLLSGTANGTINMRDEAGNTYHGVQ